MTITIAILGLGRLGASLGLNLTPRPELKVVGYDHDADEARVAQSRGVVRRAHWNLPGTVEGADLVVVALPLAEQREALPAIAPALRPGAVVTSLGPVLGPPLTWAAKALSPDKEQYFVAAHAALNPIYLHTGEAGLEAASPDLFQNGLWALAPAEGCVPEALRLVADLARLVEARPYFVDPAEHDGLAAATEGLPTLLAWALFLAAGASPGWPETRKVAERSFATATAALVDADGLTLQANRENVLRYLDALLAELQTMRGWLAANDETVLQQALTEVAEQRSRWLAQRSRGEWEMPDRSPTELPTAGSMLSRMVLGGLMGKRGGGKDGE